MLMVNQLVRNSPSWNLKVHYCVQRNLRMFPIRSHMNSIHIPVTCFFKIYFNIMFPSKPMFSNVTSSRQKVRAERCIQLSAHLILTISLLGSVRIPKLLAILQTLLQPTVISSLFGPNILLSYYSSKSSIYIPWRGVLLEKSRVAQWISKVHYRIQNMRRCSLF